MLEQTLQRIQTFFETLWDRIQDQVWFQQLRTKWDELDEQSRTYLKWASSAGVSLLFAWIFVGSAWKVHKIRADLNEKDELIKWVQSANEELTELRASIPPSASGGSASTQTLKDYVSGLAVNAGIQPGAVELGNEKPSLNRDSAREGPKETLAQLSIKKINVKQMVRLMFQIEHGSRPLKIRNLAIETHTDESGYMDATLQISAFTLKQG